MWCTSRFDAEMAACANALREIAPDQEVFCDKYEEKRDQKMKSNKATRKLEDLSTDVTPKVRFETWMNEVGISLGLSVGEPEYIEHRSLNDSSHE